LGSSSSSIREGTGGSHSKVQKKVKWWKGKSFKNDARILVGSEKKIRPYLQSKDTPRAVTLAQFIRSILPLEGLPWMKLNKILSLLVAEYDELNKIVHLNVYRCPMGPYAAIDGTEQVYPLDEILPVAKDLNLFHCEPRGNGNYIVPDSNGTRNLTDIVGPSLSSIITNDLIQYYSISISELHYLTVESFGIEIFVDPIFQDEQRIFNECSRNIKDKEQNIITLHEIRIRLGQTKATKLDVISDYSDNISYEQRMALIQYNYFLLFINLELSFYGEDTRIKGKENAIDHYRKKLNGQLQDMQRDAKLEWYDHIGIIERALHFSFLFQSKDINKMIAFHASEQNSFFKSLFGSLRDLSIQESLQTRLNDIALSKSVIYTSFLEDNHRSEQALKIARDVIENAGLYPLILREFQSPYNLTPKELWRLLIPLLDGFILLAPMCDDPLDNVLDEHKTAVESAIPYIAIITDPGVTLPIKQKYDHVSFESLPELREKITEFLRYFRGGGHRRINRTISSQNGHSEEELMYWLKG
jgi:hypothetical protein